jgi:hypothetical protein
MCGEVARQTVGDLDESVVLPVGSDQRNSKPPPHRRMVALGASEIPPLWMSPQRLVGEPDRPVNLVRVGVDAKSSRRRVVVGPRRVLLRQREVLPGMGPVLSEQLRRCALVGVGEDSGEFGRLAEDRVRASMKSARSAGMSGLGGVLALW